MRSVERIIDRAREVFGQNALKRCLSIDYYGSVDMQELDLVERQ